MSVIPVYLVGGTIDNSSFAAGHGKILAGHEVPRAKDHIGPDSNAVGYSAGDDTTIVVIGVGVKR